MTRERKRILLFLFVLDFSLIAFTLLFTVFFNPLEIIEKGTESSCIFQKLYGIYCPGCGGTRAVGYLLSFDLLNSFLHYPPLFVGIFLLIWLNSLFIYSFKKNSFYYIKKHKYYEFLLIPISILGLFFIRNILLHFGIDTLGDFSSNYF